MTKKNDNTNMEETVMGVIPAATSITFPRPPTKREVAITCGLVFATNIMIVAFFKGKFRKYLGLVKPVDYEIMKMGWAKYANKPTASVLNEYNCYIIPYSDVSHLTAVEIGRIRKKTMLSILTPQQRYIFRVNAEKRTVDRDISQLLGQVGISFSKEAHPGTE